MNSNSRKWTDVVDTSTLLLWALLFCGLMTGVLPRTFVDVAVVVICFGLLFTGNLVMAYPFMLFYFGTFGLVMGISTYRIFSLLLLLDAAIKFTKRKSVHVKILLPITVYILYLVIVLSSYSVQRALFGFVDILCALAVVGYLNESTENVRAFFKQYVIVTVVAIISGIIMSNVVTENHVMEEYVVSRFMATFEDPNYMGFFLTISTFAAVTLKLFKPAVRLIVIIAIYVAILASSSMTAIIVHIILWPLYLVVTKKINVKVFATCIILIVFALGLYQYGTEHPEAPVVGNVTYRIQEKLQAWEKGDMSGVTTNRSDLTGEHWAYFVQQPLAKLLFGGTPVNTIYISDDVYGAAHNEYVDMLLNIGILGTTIMLGYMFSNLYTRLKACIQTKNEVQVCLFMTKCTWVLYAMALTMFMEFRFMLPFFI